MGRGGSLYKLQNLSKKNSQTKSRINLVVKNNEG